MKDHPCKKCVWSGVSKIDIIGCILRQEERYIKCEKYSEK